MRKEYYPNAFVYHGPDAVSEVKNRVCGLVSEVTQSNKCTDIRILSNKFFYSVPLIFSRVLFEDNGNQTDLENLRKIKSSFGLHLWHSISHLHKPLQINSNQIVAVLARENCPITVARAADFQKF